MSAYYVPGTYPQEFLSNAGVSGKVHLLLEQDEGMEGCLAARAHPRAFRMHEGSNSVEAVGTSSQKRDTNLRLLLLAPLWVAFSCCCRAAQVNSLTSFETDIPFDYYSMPFCKPPEGVRRAGNAANLGTVIMGVKLENSQYNFTVMVRAARLCSSAASDCNPSSSYVAAGRSGTLPLELEWLHPRSYKACVWPAAAEGRARQGCLPAPGLLWTLDER